MSFGAVLERLSRLTNPYPGLRPFDSSEAHLFFGRDQQVLDLFDRLGRHRFVAITGLSGAGKSSLVRAGLVSALHRGRLLERGLRWRVAVATPSDAPFLRLANSLSFRPEDLCASSHGLIEYARTRLSQGEGLFVVIDQFEELFRYKDRGIASALDAPGHAAAASEAAAFVELLLEATRSPLPIYVAITMRTDYLGDCAEFPDFPEALNESQYLVPRLTREQRRQAIEGPLGRVRISAALVERILNDAGDEPDQLPILQHALMRTWSRWHDSSPANERPIGMTDYEAAGGFADALDQHADELLRAPVVCKEPPFVEIIFKRLTAIGRNSRERRDPATLAELWTLCGAETDADRERVNAVIDCFRLGDATFLTPRDGTLTHDRYVDIIHESLIRQWKRLRHDWYPAEHRAAKIFLDLASRARSWQRGTGEPLSGMDLTEAIEWKSQGNRSRAWAMHYADEETWERVLKYIEASRSAQEEADKRERQRREMALENEQRLRKEAERRVRLKLMFSFALTGLLLAACILAVFLWRQNRTALSRQIAAEAVEDLFLHPKSSIQQSVRAWDLAPTGEGRNAVERAFAQSNVEVVLRDPDNAPVSGAAFSWDGQRVLTTNYWRKAWLWNTATWQLQRESVYNYPILRISGDSFSPDSQRILTSEYATDNTDGPGVARAMLWDVRSS